MSRIKSIEINSLNEYISAINDNKFNDFYFRGESKKYSSISSSLLRKETSVLLNKGNFNFYENIVNEYYSEIATNLNDFESKNFLAFSQHHGLTTNLIDFTTSPLIALFFACQKIEKDTDGYIYLLDKEETIDMSGLINSLFYPPANDYNLMSMFERGINNVVSALAYNLDNFFQNNDIGPYKKDLFKICIDLQNNTGEKNQFYLNKCTEVLKDFNKIINPEIFNRLLFEDSKLNLKNGQCNAMIIIFLNLLNEYFKTLNTISLFSDCKFEIKFPNIPLFTYKTPYKFDRIRSQDGVFVYQLYYVFGKEYENVADSIIRQDVIPKYTIVVKNKEKILSELDFIGINLKTIYGDFDNIAKYINSKNFSK